MTKLKILGATVVLASAMAGSTLAQDIARDRGYCPSYPNANCLSMGSGNLSAGSYYRRRMAYRDDRYAGWTNGWRDHRNKARHSGSGFWPADVAAVVVGGAIDTAGALVTAPFRAANAHYDGYYDDDWNQSRAAPNGFVCNSGTWYRQKDGVWRLCR
jgi:hypothetical protein